MQVMYVQYCSMIGQVVVYFGYIYVFGYVFQQYVDCFMYQYVGMWQYLQVDQYGQDWVDWFLFGLFD